MDYQAFNEFLKVFNPPDFTVSPMILEPFQYFSPTSIQRAQEILLRYKDEAKVLAGGQSLIPILKMGTEIPYIVDIKNISELEFITHNTGTSSSSSIEIGALTKYVDLQYSPIIKNKIPLLSLTASGIGNPLVRNRGTIGGSLSHCDPSADLCVTSLALDGTVNIIGPDDTARKLPVDQFFLGPLTTDLKNGEILYSVSYPLPAFKTGFSFQKLTLGHGDFPLLAVSVKMEFDGTIFRNVRIAYGGVADMAIRSHDLEGMLEGRESITDHDIDEVSQKATEILEPPISLELSSDYLRKMLGVYTRRTIHEAVKKITG